MSGSDCVQHQTCGEGEYMAYDGNATHDRDCQPCPDDTFRTEQSHTYATCEDRKTCGKGQRVEYQGSPTEQRRCTGCPANTYQNETSHRSATCKNQPQCGKGEFISVSSDMNSRTAVGVWSDSNWSLGAEPHWPQTAVIDRETKVTQAKASAALMLNVSSVLRITGAVLHLAPADNSYSLFRRACKVCPDGKFQNSSNHRFDSCVLHDGCPTGMHAETPLPTDKHRTCTTNVCDCPHGQAATGVDCEEHGDPVCVSCDSNYTLVTEAKRRVVCEDDAVLEENARRSSEEARAAAEGI